MPTLIEEVVSRIRSAMGGEFGDDGTDAGCKVWGDMVPPESLPWAVLYEIGESYTFMTRGLPGVSFLADGQLTLNIFAATRDIARQLGEQVAFVLDDAEPLLNPTEGRVMMIRVMRAEFVPYTEVIAGSGVGFFRSLTISYQQQRMIGNG